MIANGGWSYFTMPSCIAPGNYILRAELIALHNAYSAGGAQFYVRSFLIPLIINKSNWGHSSPAPTLTSPALAPLRPQALSAFLACIAPTIREQSPPRDFLLITCLTPHRILVPSSSTSTVLAANRTTAANPTRLPALLLLFAPPVAPCLLNLQLFLRA